MLIAWAALAILATAATKKRARKPLKETKLAGEIKETETEIKTEIKTETEKEKDMPPRLMIQNPIWVSLTCADHNFGNLDTVFSSLDLENIDKIYLNLVQDTKRNKNVLDSLAKKYENVLTVYYAQAFYGPIHSFINTLLCAPKNAFIIVIQDHYVYSKDLVHQLASYLNEFSEVDLVMFENHFEKGFILRASRLQQRVYDIFELCVSADLNKDKNDNKEKRHKQRQRQRQKQENWGNFSELEFIFKEIFQKFNHKMLKLNF